MTEGKRTIQTIIMVIGLTVSSKLLGFLRDVFIGSRFGTGLESDAYFMALKVTATVFMGVGSAITTTMIPILVYYITKEDKKQAFVFANKILTIMFLLAAIMIPLGVVLAPYYTKYIAMGFQGVKLQLTISLIRIMFPILLCVFLTYIFVSMLQSMGKFSITSILSMPFNLILIAYLIFLTGKYGIKGLAVAIVLGWVAQFAIQLPYLYKNGYGIKFYWDRKDPDVKIFFRRIFPILLSTMVYNINTIVDSSLASTLSEGKLSALNYGFIIYTAIASTTIFGVSTVLFPKFSKSASLNDLQAFKEQVTSTIKVLHFVLVPMSVGLITLRTPIVRLAFERGAFDQQGVALTGVALTYYVLGMIGFGVQEVLNKGFFALKDTKTPTKFAIISVIINIILNLILIRKMDLAGLALATSLAAISNGVFLYIALVRKIGKMDTEKILIGLSKILIASGIMALFTFEIYKLLQEIVGTASFVEKLIVVMGSVFTGMVTYAGVTVLLKVEEAQYIIKNYLGKFYNRI